MSTFVLKAASTIQMMGTMNARTTSTRATTRKIL